jgi:YbgC/YbaW family acyl-CoA thioester hydrolase
MRESFRYQYPLRVRFAETDMQAVVFHANYLVYCDTAWTEYFREIGLPYDQVILLGADTVIAKTSLTFRAPARFDDRLDICVRTTHMGNTSIRAEFAIYRGDTLLTEVDSLYVCVDPKTLTKVPVPEALRLAIQAYEPSL